eukprot:RCo026969
MKKKKRLSKRWTLHKRYKVARKVREHPRKLRKLATKRGPRRSKKQPLPEHSIPNSWPLKAEMLEAILAEKRAEQDGRAEYHRQKKLAKKALSGTEEGGGEDGEGAVEQEQPEGRPGKGRRLKGRSGKKAVEVEGEQVEEKPQSSRVMGPAVKLPHRPKLVRWNPPAFNEDAEFE